MCLTTKQICPIRARRDIVVYKVLTKRIINLDGYTIYNTPIVGVPVNLNTTYKAYGPKSHSLACGVFEITYGYIHCYTSISAIPPLYGDRIVVKCIIRKGTLYYKSIDGRQICATEIDIGSEIGLNDSRNTTV